MNRVKICGITNYRDAAFSIKSGADFLGFVFYKKSKRYISPASAKHIIKKLPKRIFKVGVFVNEEQDRVRSIAKSCGLDILQFHGDEKPSYLASFKDWPVIKAIRIKDKIDLAALQAHKPDYFLFDAYKRGIFGGTGESFDWSALKKLNQINTPFFVSGGLSPDNVRQLLMMVRPFCVDVSSGVEKEPGKKDHSLVKKFIHIVKSRRKQ